MMNAETQQKFDNVNVGDVLVGYFSYTMSIYDFYKVVGKTKCCLKIQKLGKKAVGSEGFMQPSVAPDYDKVQSKVLTRRPDTFGCIYEDGQYSSRIRIDNKYNPKESYTEDHWD